MQWFSNMRIRNKHLLIFGLLLLIVIFIAAFSVVQITNIVNNNKELVDSYNSRQALVTEAITNIHVLRLANFSRCYMVEDDSFKNVISRNIKASEQSAKSFSGNMKEFHSIEEGDARLSNKEKEQRQVMANGIDNAFDKYMAVTEKLIAATERNDKKEVKALLEACIPLGNDLIDKLQDLRDLVFYTTIKKSTEASDNTTRIISLITYTTGGFIILLVFSLLLIVRSINRPIAVMEKAVSEIAGGNLSYPISSDRKDELGILAASISNMVSHLIAAEEQKRMLEVAEQTSKAKSEFLASISHEMRTPLNAVLGLSGLTLEMAGLSEEAAVNLEKIYSSGSTLLNIVNDILDISKIEAGKLELLPNEYDIPSLINDVITQNILRVGSKLITFSLDISPDIPASLYGDDLRIKQILNNLLSNSFKYTSEGSVELGVRCERVDDEEIVWMKIWVKDTGIGIRPEDIDKLFLKYSQVDTRANRKIEGTGLGLAITKKMVELMDGTIDVESEYGKGSTFTIRFKQKVVDGTDIGETVVNNLKSFRYSNAKRKQSTGIKRTKMPYARVLIVDDNITNLDVAKGLMKPYGMQIDCVTGGRQAIDAIVAEEGRYSAIFMDHMMPEMDGIEATKRIREIGTNYTKNIPIIALTANAVAGNEVKFLQNGFQDFLSKPIDLSRLDETLRRWVRDKSVDKQDWQ